MNKFEQYVEKVGQIITPTDAKAQEVIDNIRMTVREYVKSSNLKSLVVGISGGLDSAVVAALCQEKYTGVPLIGISIPMSSTNAHKEQAQWVGDMYCTSFAEFDGWENTENKAYENIMDILSMTDTIAKDAGFDSTTFPKNVLQGNAKARIRMITLYDMARKTEGMVLSTDNLSEYMMGFWTINGDVGDYGPIQNIGKGFELPKIAEVLGVREDIITQPPSDGLMVTEDNTDEAQLGASYKEVDAIMFAYKKINSEIDTDEFNELRANKEPKIINIIDRYNSLAYKRNGTINLTRDEIKI